MLLLTTVAVAQEPLPSLETVVEKIEAGELEVAERALRTVLERHDDPVAHDLLGVVLGRQGRFAEAEEAFNRALQGDPAPAGARQHLARLYLMQQRDAEALQLLRDAARQGPLERDLALRLADHELAAGDPAAAERQLRSVAERFRSVRALLALSRIAAGRGDFQGSLETLRQALAIAPASEDVLAANARASLAAGLPVPAILVLEPLVRMHPTASEYAYMLGVARMQVGDMPGSIEALERALELEPNRASTLLGLGLVLNHQKRYTEAEEALLRSLRFEPGNLEATAALAEAEAGLSQLEAAERHALQALEKDAAHALANQALGLIRMQQERYAEARAAFETALATDPKSAKAHYQLSLAHARLGDREASRKHQELYRSMLREDEARLAELRGDLGLPDDGGTRP